MSVQLVAIEKRQGIGLSTAIFLTVANMIGTGVFTSLGYQVVHLHSPFALLMLWVIGGLIALCGALCYAELGAYFLKSGGEYLFLSRLFHPTLGFLSGWVSLIAGFAAPVALAAMAFANYTRAVWPAVPANHTAAAVVCILTAVHGVSVRGGHRVQNFFTILKLVLIGLLIGCGLYATSGASLDIRPHRAGILEFTNPFYFVSLVYVSFAYTGWNASAYFAGELRRPAVNLPRVLISATLIVATLYTLLHYIFLRAVPQAELAGKIEIGFIAGQHIFGSGAARVLSLLIALLMVSTIGAMIFTGARVFQAMAEDYALFSFFSRWSRRGTPLRAIVFQSAISLLFIYTSTFEQVLIYTTSVLIVMNNLSVASLFVLRAREKSNRGYRVPAYPVTPLVFLLLNGAIMGYVSLEKPVESLIGAGILVTGLLVHAIAGKRQPYD